MPPEIRPVPDLGEPLTIHTPRLVLRPWTEADRLPFALLNADPVVMEHFPAPLPREASDEFATRIEVHIREHGWGLWAVEVRGVDPFIGFVGLWPAGPDLASGRATVEIGWRLAAAAWGRGYATEAARAVLDMAWQRLGLDEVVSFTAETNRRSVAVMERIGMTFDGVFDHPALPPGHRLRRHVRYRVRRPPDSSRPA